MTTAAEPMETHTDDDDDIMICEDVRPSNVISPRKNASAIQKIVDKISVNVESDPDDDLQEVAQDDSNEPLLNEGYAVSKSGSSSKHLQSVHSFGDSNKVVNEIGGAKGDTSGVAEGSSSKSNNSSVHRIQNIVNRLSLDTDSDSDDVDVLRIDEESPDAEPASDSKTNDEPYTASKSETESIAKVSEDTSSRLKAIIDEVISDVESDPDNDLISVDEQNQDGTRQDKTSVEEMDADIESNPDEELSIKLNEKRTKKLAESRRKSSTSSEPNEKELKEAENRRKRLNNIVNKLAQQTFESDPDDDLEVLDVAPPNTPSKTSTTAVLGAENANKTTADGSSTEEEFRGFDVPPKKKTQEIVIISDDEDKGDDPHAKRRKFGPKKIPCCNAECTSTDDIPLYHAPVFVLTYYGLKYRRGLKNEVCDICFDRAMRHQENVVTALIDRKPLFDLVYPDRNVAMVDLSDSDDESDQIPSDEFLSEASLKVINENLEDIIQKVIKKFDYKFQVESSLANLEERVARLEPQLEELNTVMEHDLQEQLDRYRRDLYSTYRPRIQELPPLEIVDVPETALEPPVAFSPESGQYRQVLPKAMAPRVALAGAGSPATSTPPSSPKALTGEVSIVPVQQQPESLLRTYADTNKRSDPSHNKPLSGVATKKVTQVLRPIVQSSQDESNSTAEGIQDVVAIGQKAIPHRPLPPIGSLVRPQPRVGDLMCAMKLSFFGIWSRCRVVEIAPKGSELPRLKPTDPIEHSTCNQYKIKWESNYRKGNSTKLVSGKQLAYTQACPVRFPVGTRVIAIFRDNEWTKECYYAGIIAEPPKYINKYRYLVFFDDGYTQYVPHEKILLVSECSRNVWDDVHPDSRDFIRKYLEAYPERPMVKMLVGQIVKTEWNGRWWIARVIAVDASLVHMSFDADGRTEWMYRGSTRLGPLYAEMVNAKSRAEQGSFPRHRSKIDFSTLKKRNLPYVEYTRGAEAESDTGAPEIESESETPKPSRSVAKKSTARKSAAPSPDITQSLAAIEQMPSPLRNLNAIPGGVKTDFYDLSSYPGPRRFLPHQCGPLCIAWIPYVPETYKFCGPLAVPLHCAWRRSIAKCKMRSKKMVVYTAPCGRRLRTMEELSRYLRLTHSSMGVDLFDFDFWVSCLNEFVLHRHLTNIKDMSYGVEYMQVPCVNYIDHQLPEYVTYTTRREPNDDVLLNNDKEFLTGCDCLDGCQDRDKCACWQLTFAGTAFGQTGPVDNTIGYANKRLIEPVLTGIYECNVRCKCSSTCSNRVVQNPLRAKLQVFKTYSRGWGIRSLNDIPQGAFICIYAGKLLTESAANESGKNYGDDYLAELDYIEVVERLKEGYEEQVKRWGGDDRDNQENDPDKGKQKSKKRSKKKEASEDEVEEERTRDSDEDFQPLSLPKMKSTSIDTRSSSRLRKKLAEKGSEDKKEDQRKSKGGKEKAEKEQSEKEKVTKEKGVAETVEEDDTIVLSDDEDENARKPQKFAPTNEPNTDDDLDDERPLSFTSIRHYFEEDGTVYIMDAKTNGNIGRYLNHSCTPNVFVQNVFVDTHDLRFPWVAFFALSYIPAGTELTWDYNYDIGSVPGKKLICQCGSSECRGRLL